MITEYDRGNGDVDLEFSGDTTITEINDHLERLKNFELELTIDLMWDDFKIVGLHISDANIV